MACICHACPEACVTHSKPSAHAVAQVEECGMKLAHQFPWAAGAYVAVGLALRRRELSHPDVPSSALKRKQITKVPLNAYPYVLVISESRGLLDAGYLLG